MVSKNKEYENRQFWIFHVHLQCQSGQQVLGLWLNSQGCVVVEL